MQVNKFTVHLVIIELWANQELQAQSPVPPPQNFRLFQIREEIVTIIQIFTNE